MALNERITLANLAGGAAVEMFDAALCRVLDDVLDLNKKPTDTREVTLKIKIKPDEDRELVDISIHPTVKLGATVPYKTQAYVGTENGEIVATEYNPKQLHMKDQERIQADAGPQESAGKVLPMERKEG